MPLDIEAGSGAYLKMIELQQSLLQSQQIALAAQQRLELAEKALDVSRDFDAKVNDEVRSVPKKSADYPKYEGNYDHPGELDVDRALQSADSARRPPLRNDLGQGSD